MQKSSTLRHPEPIAEPIEDQNERRSIIETFFARPKMNRFVWITRRNNDKTVKDYVLEDTGDFLLISRRYAPNLYVRAGVMALVSNDHAMTVCRLILDAKWSDPKLKQVLIRIHNKTVPIEAFVSNASHQQNFTPLEVMDYISRAQAVARWYILRHERRFLLAKGDLPPSCKPIELTDSLDILCRGELLWAPQDGEVYRAYYLDGQTGEIRVLRYAEGEAELQNNSVPRPPKAINALSIEMYKKWLTGSGVSLDQMGARKNALGALCAYYQDHLAQNTQAHLRMTS